MNKKIPSTLETILNFIIGLLSIPFFLIYLLARWIREIIDAFGGKEKWV